MKSVIYLATKDLYAIIYLRLFYIKKALISNKVKNKLLSLFKCTGSHAVNNGVVSESRMFELILTNL